MNANDNDNGNGKDDSPLLKALAGVKAMQPKDTVTLNAEAYNLILLQLEGLAEPIDYAGENLNQRIDVMAKTLADCQN